MNTFSLVQCHFSSWPIRSQDILQHFECEHIEAGTNWPSVCRRHFQIPFLHQTCIFIQILLKYVPKGPADINPALVQIMAWRQTGNKLLSKPMLSNFGDIYIYASFHHNEYRQTSNISRTFVSNKIVDHSAVVGASPTGAAPTTSSFLT